jgi:glutathione S-transferase
MKLELWLRMAGLEYECVYHHDPRSAPRAKLPFIEIDGEAVPDSNEVVTYLKQQLGVTIDQHLNVSQLADSYAWRFLVEEQLNLYLTFTRFNNPEIWQLFKHSVFSELPLPQAEELPELLKQGITPGLNARGFTLANQQRVTEQALADVDALSDFLGEKVYFLGDQISTIDSSVAAVLLHAVAIPWQDALVESIRQKPNLMAYCRGMLVRYFPESPALQFLN